MGQDKALMPFLGRPLIMRQVERLRVLDAAVLVVTNRPADYEFLGLPLFPDRVQGLGPLGGLVTAFEAAQSALLAVVACDMPFINPALLAAQRDLLVREGADVVIPRSPEGLEPLHAVYRRERCLPAVHAALQAGRRKMITWFEDVTVREMTSAEVAAHDPAFRSFINVNSPDEFRQAEEWARAED
jgi:molybdenum cofactor guanylyltransferase